MRNRRTRFMNSWEQTDWFKRVITAYLIGNAVLLILSAGAYLASRFFSLTSSGFFFARTLPHATVCLWAFLMAGTTILLILRKKCRECLAGPGQRITSAMNKMSHGDLGWKLILRRGDELAEVADSVSDASRSLAQRIGLMQSQVRGISEIESHLIDTIDTDRPANPGVIAALRRLKINTSRLQANLHDFQISSSAETDTRPPGPLGSRLTLTRSQHMQSVGGQ